MQRPDFFGLGYDKLVLIRKGQKRPLWKGWQHSFPTPEQVESHDGGIGIYAAHTPAFDLDLYDVDLAAEIMEIVQDELGYAPIRSSHRPASKLLMYRAEEPFSKVVLDLGDRGLVEVLGQGRQYVVDGPHPSGGQYRVDEWRPHAELDLITKEQVMDVLWRLANKYDGTIRGRADKSSAPPPETLLAPSMDELAELVGNTPNDIDDRDEYIRFSMAVYGASGGSQDGFEIWLEWFNSWDGEQRENPERVWNSLHSEHLGWDYLTSMYAPELGATADFSAEPAPASTGEGDLTESHAAKLILPFIKGRALVYGRERFTFDGSVWRHATDDVPLFGLVADALQPVAEIYFERDRGMDRGKNGGRTPLAVKTYNFARHLRNESGIRKVMNVVKPLIAEPELSFEPNPDVINTPAGIMDLRNGEIRPVRPEDRTLHRTAFTPDPTMRTPAFDAFLDFLTYGDQELMTFLRVWAGYMLTGHTSEKKFVFAYGGSNTGKTTLINILRQVMGTYGRSTNIATFMGRKTNTDALAQLIGRRMVSASEPRSDYVWDDGLIKELTGRELIEARRLYGSEMTYRADFKIMTGGNHAPNVEGLDAAFLRRMLVLPVDRAVPDHMMDRNLPEKLLAEGPGILHWMTYGARQWYENGLPVPDAVKLAGEEYRDEIDLMAQWMAEEITFGENEGETAGDLYKSWLPWAKAAGEKNVNLRGFSRDLKQYVESNTGGPIIPDYVYRVKRSHGLVYQGMGLRAHANFGV